MTCWRVIDHEKYWQVKCPATGYIDIPRDGRWRFNGNYERPTFTPSVNATWGKPGQTMEDFKADPNPERNHCYIKDGRIEYLYDCTHDRAGTTVEIPLLSYAEMRQYHPNVACEKSECSA